MQIGVFGIFAFERALCILLFPLSDAVATVGSLAGGTFLRTHQNLKANQTFEVATIILINLSWKAIFFKNSVWLNKGTRRELHQVLFINERLGKFQVRLYS